ncbi:TetR/AcrR family transcriptional regulator [Mesorhizobium sp. 1B3]|uniref:TetR/AcrR family transcriptional regulator n=1 Tax=Mesorhizobium sp. 1B3 TaxID=3243599 RepID=UPI003D96C6DB
MPREGRIRTNDPQGTRRKVLDAAAEAFQTKGYHATSIGDLVEAAGISGGALHHHFATKKAIGLAVISERVSEAVEETWIKPIWEAGSARQGVRSVFMAIADELDRQGFVRGCPLNNLAHELSLADPDFRAAISLLFGRWRNAVADKMRADQQAGIEERTDPERFASLVIATYSGAMAMAKADQDATILRVCCRSDWN